MGNRGRAVVVLLGVLAGLAAAIAGVAVSVQMKEHTLRLAKEHELGRALAENDELQQQERELRTAKEQAMDEMAKAAQELEETKRQLADERQAKVTLAKSVDERQREIDRLVKDLEQIRSERTTLVEQVKELKSHEESLRTQLTELEKARLDLEAKLPELSDHPTVELDKVVVNSDGAGTTPIASIAPSASSSSPSESSAAAPGPRQGQVLVVNREYDFIVVNLGKNQGLEIGQEFQITRGAEVLGRAKVEKVYDELSAAAILPESNKDGIHEGDAVKAI